MPSLTDTDMVRDFKLFRWVIPMTPQQVAKALVAGLEKDSPEILVGWQSHLAVWCQRLAPWLLEQILQLATPPRIRNQNPEVKFSFLTRIQRWSDFVFSRNMPTFVSARKS